MTIPELASALRHRLRENAAIDYRVLVAMSDRDVIDSYIVCSRCGGELFAVGETLKTIERLETAQQFAAECSARLQKHRC